MSLSKFFGCKKVKTVFEKHEFKGIYFSSATHLFYVFINNYYIKSEIHLIDRNFRIVWSPKLIKQAKTVRFNGSNPEIERRSMKYVKQTIHRAYLTVNPYLTYSLEFEYGEEIGQIMANKMEDKFAHKCPNQILEINGINFCFEASVSLNRK